MFNLMKTAILMAAITALFMAIARTLLRAVAQRVGALDSEELRATYLIGGWRARGYQVGFGVGLASGSATVGRIGYESRFDYTAIGSVVNLAARLCASAADREILIDAEVAGAIKARRSLKALGNRPIKGYDEAMPVFGIPFDDQH